MIDRSRRVVLLIDYDNLQICASRDTPGRDLQLPPVVQLAQHYGTVILARAYAEWNLSTERLAVYKAGIEPAFAPVLRTESDRSGKSLADTVMVAEGMDMLWTLSPDVVVLATSDKDLIPLVRVAKQRGAFVVVLGSDFTAIPLREMADEHVTYKQLITDSQGRYVTEAGAARQPAALPEPARRRSTRERNGRERTLTMPTAAAAAPAVVATPPPARIEREPQTIVAPSQIPASSPSAVEPVAPLSGAGSGEGDAQGLGRRRRRRGSRRRSERIGGVSEGLGSSEGSAEPEGSYAEGSEAAYDDPEPEDLGERPVAEGNLNTGFDVYEAPSATLEAPVPELADTPSSAPNEPAGEGPPPAPAPRNRRRTARRPVTQAATRDAELAPPIAPEGVVAPAPAVQAALTPDILWAPEPSPANGAPAAEDADPGAPIADVPGRADVETAIADSEPPVDEGVVAPRPRSRRIASAARGRTRPATSR